MEYGVTHLAVEGGPDPHGELDGLAVEHGQRPGEPEAHRADVGVGLVAERVAAPAEQLGLGPQLAVHLETDDRLPAAAALTHASRSPPLGRCSLRSLMLPAPRRSGDARCAHSCFPLPAA